jgi:small GTP-binding protein
MSSSPKNPQQQQQNQNQRARQRKPLKIVVVGSASVGKTSILRQFVYKTYDPKSTQTTIGCDFWHRNLTLVPPAGFNNNPSTTTGSGSASSSAPSSPVRNTNNNNASNDDEISSPSSSSSSQQQTVDVSLQVWDTAGMDTGFQSLAPSFFRGADGALLVYDLSSAQSFENAKTWRDMFVAHAGYHAPILLVGNKLDLVEERKVNREDAENFVKQSTENRQAQQQRQQSQLQSNNSSFSGSVSESGSATSTGNNNNNNNNNAGGIMVCGAVELTASDADAVEKAFIQLTTAMLEVEKARALTETVTQGDLKRIRLGSLPPNGRDGNSNAGGNNNGNNNNKSCKC